MSPTLALSSVKVISTVGLGLIAGYAIASPFLITPTIYKLSTRDNAPHLTQTQVASGRFLSGSSALIGTALASVYGVSEPLGRHPYMIYASILAFGTAAASELLATRKASEIVAEMNGEDLAGAFEGLIDAGYLVSALGLLAFGVSVVGNYGDYY